MLSCMLLGTRKTFYDHIIEALLEKTMSVSELQACLTTRNVSASVQGIYGTLRQLISEDIVVKQKKTYSINNVWTGKLLRMISKRPLFQLQDGDQTIYRFKKIDHSDAFWKHVFTDIEDEVGHSPLFCFMAHQFWIHIPERRQSELAFYESLERNRVHGYTVIGGDSACDKETKETLISTYNQIHLDAKASINRRDHICTKGHYVIITRVSKSFAQVIDGVYKTSTSEKELQQRLGVAFKKSGLITITVEHNPEKARKFRKYISDSFHVPKEFRDSDRSRNLIP